MVLIQDLGTSRVIESGFKSDGLYRLTYAKGVAKLKSSIFALNKDVVISVSNACNDVSHLHARLGHTSVSKMSHLNFVSAKHLPSCETYIFAKMHRLQFPISNTVS